MSGPFGRRSGPPAGQDPTPEAAPEGPPPVRPAVRSSAVTWILGVVTVLFLAGVTLNTISTDEPGSRGIADGTKMPSFATPLATGDLEGDANVDQKKACGVRGPEILNSCQLTERGPLVLVFTATRSKKCLEQVDAVERVRKAHADIQFAAVGIRGDREDLRRTMRERGWGMPVGYDRDGAVSTVYAVAICPTITFARRGGVIEHTSLGLVSQAEIERWVEKLEP